MAWRMPYNATSKKSMVVDTDSGFTMELTSSQNFEISATISPYKTFENQVNSQYFQAFYITDSVNVNTTDFINSLYPVNGSYTHSYQESESVGVINWTWAMASGGGLFVFFFVALGFYLWHRKDMRGRRAPHDSMRESIINPEDDSD